jgi:hypothetical protein
MLLVSSALVVGATLLGAELPQCKVLYDVRLGNQVLGRAELEIGPVTRASTGREVRSARLQASARQGAMTAELAAVLDAGRMEPLRARLRRGSERQVDEMSVAYHPRHLEVTRTEKGNRIASRLAIPSGVTDLVGWISWIGSQDLAPGASATRTLYTGTRLVTANTRAIQEEEVRTQLGTERALRLETVVGSGPPLEGQPPEPPKDELLRFTLWRSQGRYRVPIKIEVSLGSLGLLTIEARDRRGEDSGKSPPAH